ncbi:hypothetical protein B0H19DRAFT_66994 [Mycena capillaripes]|nr:hypothetical protein B0H19DRAFT_66994 [Mycena capillaripes]
MHRCCNIPEVVELICGEAKFSTLASLARTCQMFQPSAFAVLWENQKDLLQLLKCTPSDLWEELPVLNSESSTFLRFLRPVVASDWRRVLVYAVHVKSLIYEDRRSDSVYWEIFVAMSLSLPVSPLFPNIRHLTWKTNDRPREAPPKPCLTIKKPYLRLMSDRFCLSSAPASLRV